MFNELCTLLLFTNSFNSYCIMLCICIFTFRNHYEKVLAVNGIEIGRKVSRPHKSNV